MFIGLLLISPLPAGADCINPSAEEGVVLYNEDQNVPQFCDGTNWVAMSKLNPAAGGSGCTAPSGIEGVILYNSDIHVPQYCDGDTWVALGGGYGPQGDGSCDLTPGSFTFTDLTDYPTPALVKSEIVQITDLAFAAIVSISGDGSPQFRTCNDSACASVDHDWTSAQAVIDNDQYLQLRMTTNPAFGATNNSLVTVGTQSDQWSITSGVTGTISASAYTGTGQSSGSTNTPAVTGLSIGAASANRWVVAAITSDGNSIAPISDVLIAGIPAVIAVQDNNTSGEKYTTAIAYAKVSTGTTADVSWVLSANNSYHKVWTYTIEYDGTAFAMTTTNTASQAHTAGTVTVGVSIDQTSSFNIIWTNATEASEDDSAQGSLTSGHRVYSVGGNATVSANGTELNIIANFAGSP